MAVTATPSTSSSPTATATATATAAATAVNLCVEVTPSQPSTGLGQTAQWAVAAWATGGNVAGVTIRLQTTPATAGTAEFTIGCGSGDGTSTCSLGTVDASSAQRQLQAQVAIPLTASTVTSVSLTATGSATGLGTDPAASAAVSVTGSVAPVGASASLPTGLLPGMTAPSATVSSGGSVAGLLPTLDPSSSATTGTRQVASTSALPGGETHIAAELAGLVALAAAFVFAVTRVTIRRPAASAPGTGTDTAPLPPVELPRDPDGPDYPPAASGE